MSPPVRERADIPLVVARMPLTYRNPVWHDYFADPFVLRWRDDYYAYGTGSWVGDKLEPDAMVFPLLRSRDLVKWEDLGGAVRPLDDGVHRAYWAPEVAVRDDDIYLYYSTAPAGRDEQHRLHVAKAAHPAGPFLDHGRVELPDAFSIDANPFRDPRDGRWYLFYATDFFDGRVGTGIAVVPLADDMRTPLAPPQAAVRATADWQIYERDRLLYGRQWSAWHTVEGPCVVEHAGRYYCFYSGGNWQTPDYGVSVAEADHPLGPWREVDASDGATVLRQRSAELLGPGHNSVVLAPDGRTHLIVYHAWDREKTGRRMCLDPLEWTADGPRCAGPTTTLQTLP